MPKINGARGGKPSRGQNRKKLKPKAAASSPGSRLRQLAIEPSPIDCVENFNEVAKLIAVDPPDWLAEHLRRWSSTILMNHAVELHQPTRRQMGKTLSSVGDAAALLQRALANPSVREFLDAGADCPINSPGKIQMILGEVRSRAEHASALPALVNEKGKTKAGRGPALLDGAISAQAYCALFIAETWKWFSGKYPAPRNRIVAKAIDLYWRLSGGQVQHWGAIPSQLGAAISKRR